MISLMNADYSIPPINAFSFLDVLPLLEHIDCYQELCVFQRYDTHASGMLLWRGMCATLKRGVCYVEEGCMLLWRGVYATLKRDVCYFKEGCMLLYDTHASVLPYINRPLKDTVSGQSYSLTSAFEYESTSDTKGSLLGACQTSATGKCRTRTNQYAYQHYLTPPMFTRAPLKVLLLGIHIYSYAFRYPYV